ncbi:MAG: sigma-54-dependent transcriptional regulator [bacterium]
MGLKKVMFVDDDDEILFAFREVVKKEGYLPVEARDGQQALEQFDLEKPEVIFMDVSMPNLDGLEALKQFKKKNRFIPVIMITGKGNMKTAINAMKLGAFDYLTKPLSVKKVRQSIAQALSSSKKSSAKPIHFDAETMDRHELIGVSDVMQNVYKLIGSISVTPNHTSVLITGESGTGKELVARAIHKNGPHAEEPYMAVNCTTLPENLLESELFGHEKGAFTGAAQRKLGKFEVAGCGTIFLDEIGDLSTALQQKLLRVLQERQFERLGGHDQIEVQARFVAATNQNIAESTINGRFREDLFYRLNVATIHLPPLRERKEDIVLLAYYFLTKYNHQFNKAINGFSKQALSLLQAYSYHGNVRELENLIERAVMLTQGKVILPEIFSEMFTPPAPEATLLPIISSVFKESREHLLNQFEKQFVTEQLTKNCGNVSAAARMSQMSRQNFHRLLSKHQIQPERLI